MFGLSIKHEPNAEASNVLARQRAPFRVEHRKRGEGGEPLIRVYRDHGRFGFARSAWYTDWNRPFAGERRGA